MRRADDIPAPPSSFAGNRGISTMAAIAKKTRKALWDEVKTKVTEAGKGGRPGQWSARKAQLATQEYKARGGTYDGAKSKDNHLSQWTNADWNTKSGAKSQDSGERYLPKRARKTLTENEYKRTTLKKKADTAKGKQFSAQPKDIAKKTSGARTSDRRDEGRLADLTRVELLKRAASRGIAGRSRMRKAELLRALD
jgi:hypothetical protein